MELQLQDIEKHYGKKEALKKVNLTLTPGIYGLLGPNGAGKSTMMNILTGNLKQSGGVICLDGQNIQSMGKDFRMKIGYCPQQQTFYPSFTAEQFLAYMASLHGMTGQQAKERIDWVLQKVSLTDVRHKTIGSLSGGMKQRLLLAQSILHDPCILILDEPTAGLDPRQRIAVRNLIGEIALHKIVLIATHVVQDVEYIAKELILLSEGTVLCQSTPQELLRSLENEVWEIHTEESMLPHIQACGTICGIAKEETGIMVRFLSQTKPDIPCVPAAPTVEDVYLHYFGQTEEP
jgi:ABC-type multidrug transport system ATPase subunit